MKTLTILQPFAHLIVFGEKRVENRTWLVKVPPLGIPLAIHAGKKPMIGCDLDWAQACACEPRLRNAPRMALGAVIGTARLVACMPIEDYERMHGPDPYAHGPYCWVLEDVQPLREPVPARGSLGLWEWQENPVPCSSRR